MASLVRAAIGLVGIGAGFFWGYDGDDGDCQARLTITIIAVIAPKKASANTDQANSGSNQACHWMASPFGRPS